MGYKDKEKQREYQRLWRERRRRDWFDKNGPCIKCHSWENLEIDHIDPKLKTSHRIWSWSEKRRDRELAKCQVLCKVCHAEKSATTKPRGENQGNSKLSDKDALQIKYLLSLDMLTYKQIADMYDVNESVVGKINRGEMWKHIPESSSMVEY
jgi:hypothetical protein